MWYRAWREADASGAAWAHLDWSRRERKVYTFATRLLWTYASEHGHSPTISLAEPLIGSPPPVEWNGRLISQDLANSALELAFMAPALDGAPRSFLEVGAGYGRSAYALLSLFPNATYTIVDIEPAIDISRWYLTQLFPPERLRFLSPDQTDSIGQIDVAVSISSLHEMLPETVEKYLNLFDRVAGAAYLKQWTRWHNPADDLDMAFAAYPFPSRWQRIRWDIAPVQTGFTEALFAIPQS
jgi:putative sugar O-methyltransferase